MPLLQNQACGPWRPETFNISRHSITPPTAWDRPRFLAAWLDDRDGRETLVLEQDGTIDGFITARACTHGTKLGPLVAPDINSALGLVGAAAARTTPGPLIIDLPETNTLLRRELEAIGYTDTFATARMYRGPAPETGPGLQAIATMELG